MTTLRTVPKSEWRRFFDRMSKALPGKLAEIEVASLDLGDQIVAEWVPLLGVTYDSQDDLVDVALDRFDHLIRHPKAIMADEADEGVTSVAIVDADGTRQVVKFRSPLLLPPAAEPVGRPAK